jgi:hypothetical protein
VLSSGSGNTATYLQFEGAGNKFFAWDNTNGVQNGLEVDFANLLFFFGNYRISDGGLYIDATNHTFILNQSNYNSSGSMEFQAYELKFTGTNIEDNTFTPTSTPTYLKITLNGTPYYIACQV